MENRQKIVVGVMLTLIGCVATPLAFYYLGGNEPKIELEVLQQEFNTVLQTQLTQQKQELEAEYNKKISEFESMTDEERKQEQENVIKNKRITEKLKDIVLSYYENPQDRALVVHSIDGNELITTLKINTNGKGVKLKDNGKNISNIYSVSHTNTKDKTINNQTEKIVEKNDIIFKVITDNQDKFDISDSKLMLEYFNAMLGKDLTDEEKVALNIQANMNLNELSSISDLNMYIYNGDSLKIGDFVFKCVKGKDEETKWNYFEYTISSHTVTEVKYEEEPEVNTQATDSQEAITE